MASKKKESEGIALLSMYGDEDDDMEEDVDNDDNNNNDKAVPTENKEQSEVGPNETVNMEEDDSEALNNSNITSYNYASNTAPLVNLDTANDCKTPDSIDNSTPPPLTAQQAIGTEPSRGREGTLTIVDYGHDEAALSPEAEEGEIPARGRVMFGAELQTANGTPPVITPSRQATPPESAEHVDQSQSDLNRGKESESAATEEAATNNNNNNDNNMSEGVLDPLDKFLPPPPTSKCSDELQEKMIKFLMVKKKTGRSFNSEVRNRKEYRNPDFLTHAVTYQNIDQIGTCFSKDVFDPHGYHQSDFYDEIEADIKREAERKEQEKKKNQKIDFLSGGTQSLVAIPTPKILPIPVAPVMAGGGSNPVDTGTREARPNKKSKWDKVDGERRQPVSVTTTTSGSGSGQDSAALLSASANANASSAGSGYTAFAQQRRREAEERRSIDRKLDRRS